MTMNQTLAILGGNPTIPCGEKHYVWPRITKSVEEAVIQQLHTSLSLYKKSGVFATFEQTFARAHERRFALLENSGTSALHAIYEGIELEPGDEVIVPAYTFFATISPLMHTGAIPIFCDCDETGNIDPQEIARHITPRTKAVVVTHMWGMPCDMQEITELCQQHQLALLEDCSHAHGASYQQKKVGTFGKAAAWSLQGQKIITGGEGGILLTDDETVYYRAVLQGHYNNRCKQEIPPHHPLSEFALTGYGLKLRAHPLAVAIAAEQFSHLESWIHQKQRYVEQFIAAFKPYPFLKTPCFDGKQSSWYAFVLQFDENRSNGVSLDLFYKALLAEGLVEVDRPVSTGTIYRLPLFTKPHLALPRLYHHPLVQEESYLCADQFARQALKLPVWVFPDEEEMVHLYIQGIQKVADVVMKQSKMLTESIL